MYELMQIYSSDKLHHEIRRSIMLTGSQCPDDVHMFELREQPISRANLEIAAGEIPTLCPAVF